MDTNNEEIMASSKDKPHPTWLLSEAEMKKLVFKEYQKEMEERKKEYYFNNGYEINFSLAQNAVKQDSFINQVLNVSCFYVTNYTGNKDFMHIPDIRNVADNFVNHPTMMATKKTNDGSEEIIGIATMKFENNNSMNSNPVFPTKNENILFITGVLTKNYELSPEEVRISGVGKELYKAAIRGAYNINKQVKTRVVCEIDCRNVKSVNAVLKAVNELNNLEFGVSSYIVGYYEKFNKKNKLMEAPTLIVEIEFDSTPNYNIGNDKVEFSYIDCKMSKLNFEISKRIQAVTKENIKYITATEEGYIVYHDIDRINLDNVDFKVGNSADGNCREPVLNPFVELIN